MVSIFTFVPAGVFAQQSVTSNPVVTRVGEAPEDQRPLASPSPVASTQPGGPVEVILDWASQITNSLARGIWGYLNRFVNALSNGSYSTGTWAGANEGSVYWCTYLIIDSYNLAGYGGLTKSAHAAVVNMRRWWKTTGASSGYVYVDYENNKQSVANVQPGYAMFMESSAGTHTGREHVNMVKEINIDANGNGKIVTIDSNSSSISHSYPVADFQVKNTPYPVRGFGGI